MNPITIATRAKGLSHFVKRASLISNRYGLTPRKMDQIMSRFARVLHQFECGATFPTTASVLRRNRGVLEKFQGQGIEFAVHGNYHIDHTQLTLAEQLDHLSAARQIFSAQGLECCGFRCPYLRWNEDTMTAVSRQNFTYDSSEALHWDVVDGFKSPAYERVLGFYGAQPAEAYPALPRIENGLVRVPYCIPDDEALGDRLRLNSRGDIETIWLEMLRRCHEDGLLFTLGLHPERITVCEAALRATLTRARKLCPPVWIARLDEIANWWRRRAETRVNIVNGNDGSLKVSVDGPAGVTVLARGVRIEAATQPWAGGFERVGLGTFTVRSLRRPFIGVSPEVSPALTDFLRQQGYIVELAERGDLHLLYFSQRHFAREDELPLLAEIKRASGPLLQLGRWPHGAQSALCVTGDIDALTLWDYNMRFLGK